MRMNSTRGLLREFGIVFPVGAARFPDRVQSLIENADAAVPMVLRDLLHELVLEIDELESRIKAVEKHLEALAVQTPVVERLRTIPGVGLLTATALVGFVGDVARFPSGRHFAAYLGLTPREHSSGARRRLGRISKQGDVYLRMLLIHGARAVLQGAQPESDPDRFRSEQHTIFPAAARLRFELMDEPVRPARGKADNKGGHFWPVQRLAPSARISSWPGAMALQ